MSGLKPHAESIADDLAQRCGFSTPAVLHMMRAVDAGWGGMASFDHPEFGGPGQWMQGGMVMLGEPFDHALRGRVDALCNEIAGAYERGGPLTEREDSADTPQWPASLGTPGATGSQTAPEADTDSDTGAAAETDATSQPEAEAAPEPIPAEDTSEAPGD